MKNKRPLRVVFCILSVIAVFFSFITTNDEAVFARDTSGVEFDKGPHNRHYPMIFNGESENEGQDPIGPIGGTFTAVVVDPNLNNVVYAGSYHSGVYKSYDSGLTWYSKSVGLRNLQIQSLATHPYLSTIIYAGTYEGGLYVSKNRGQTWEPSSGGLLDNHIIYDIEIDRNNPSVMFTASRINGSLVGYISKSTDGGRSWRLVFKGDVFNTDDYFYDIDIHPNNSSLVFLAAHEHGFYRSHDAGLNYYPILNGLEDLSARGFAFDTSLPELVYGVVWKSGYVYRSHDLGITWANSRIGLPPDVRVTKVYTNPFGSGQKRVFVTTRGFGLYSSDDLGVRWRARGLSDLHLNDMAIANTTPQTWYIASQNDGMIRSLDEGASWRTIMKDLRLYTVTGMSTLSSSSDTLFVSIYGKGVYAVLANQEEWLDLNEGLEDLDILGISGDENQLWAWSNSGLWRREGNSWQKVVLPETEVIENAKFMDWRINRSGMSTEGLLENDNIYSEASNNSQNARSLKILGLSKSGNQLVIATDDGVWVNNDEGWLSLGLERLLVSALNIDLSNGDVWANACNDEQVCSVMSYRDGIWTERSNGLEQTNVNKLMWIDGKHWIASNQGLYQWDSEKEQWHLIAGEGHQFADIIQHPSQKHVLIASGKGLVLKSEDAGNTWHQIPVDGQWTYAFVGFESLESKTLYLGTVEKGAFKINLD